MFLGWPEDDRAWAIALQQVEDDECPGCGHPLSETTGSDSMGRYTAVNLWCQGCIAGGIKARGENPDGLHTQVVDKRRGAS